MELVGVKPAVAIAVEVEQYALSLCRGGGESKLLERAAHLGRAQPAVAILVEELESAKHLGRRWPPQRLLLQHIGHQCRKLAQSQPPVGVGVILLE